MDKSYKKYRNEGKRLGGLVLKLQLVLPAGVGNGCKGGVKLGISDVG